MICVCGIWIFLKDAEKYCDFLGYYTLYVGVQVPKLHRNVADSIFSVVHCKRRYIPEDSIFKSLVFIKKTVNSPNKKISAIGCLLIFCLVTLFGFRSNNVKYKK
jgi:hypothetical protein